MTVSFTMIFEEPYVIGLLVKKKDYLRFNLKKPYEGNEDFYSGLFIGNATETRLVTEEQKKSMDIIFDWENPTMALFRTIASNMYYVLIGLVFF